MSGTPERPVDRAKFVAFLKALRNQAGPFGATDEFIEQLADAYAVAAPERLADEHERLARMCENPAIGLERVASVAEQGGDMRLADSFRREAADWRCAAELLRAAPPPAEQSHEGVSYGDGRDAWARANPQRPVFPEAPSPAYTAALKDAIMRDAEPVASPPAMEPEPELVEIRPDENGDVDEIVMQRGHFHLERLDTDSWWVGLQPEGSPHVTMYTISGKRTKLTVTDESGSFRRAAAPKETK